LDPSLVSQIGSWSEAECAPPYTVGAVSIIPCTKRVSISVERGAPLGTMLATMDWGATDRRTPLGFVNASRMGGDILFGQNYAACPVDYLPPAVRASVHNMFGEGTRRRTAEPVCGTVMQDVPGTAQGRWFVNDDVDERLHLALVRDYIDPAIAAFSVGTSVPSLPTDLYRFSPAGSGRLNLDFQLVRPGSQVYCYELTSQRLPSARVVLIQLVTEQRLRIEGRAGASCGPSEGWAFSASATEFAR
jgi:hypothetical protein